MIIKYLAIFIVLYFISNIGFWSYQEYIHYEDMQTIRSLGNAINLTRVSIDEKAQEISTRKSVIEAEKVVLDKLIIDKKFNEYNALVGDYNNAVKDVNTIVDEYENLVDIHNENVMIINDLILTAGKRDYLFPIQSYTPELYRELQK